MQRRNHVVDMAAKRRALDRLETTPPNPPARAVVMITTLTTIAAALLVGYVLICLIDSETLP
jgi:hypothetical protein